MSCRLRNLYVVDSGAPWIRSLLLAMPAGVRVHGFRVQNAFSFPSGLPGMMRKHGSSEAVSESWDDVWVGTPSWNKTFRISSWLVVRQIKKDIRVLGQPDAILFTLPWYAAVAESLKGCLKVYYAHDTFRFYDWNRRKTIALEGRLLRACDIGFGVARRVVADLQELASTPVHYLPMATGWGSGDNTCDGKVAAEIDYRPIPRPRVGCVGQINSSAYDWELIEHLSASFPGVHFVFIGPRFKEKSSSAANRISAVFTRPNIHWIGPKPHSHLPAYLRCFDVCINPLCVSEHNHRRSPLRLFDYLTTDRPILSTAIAEAFNHVPFVSIANDKEEFHRLLGEALALKAAPDLERRRDYIAANTWHARADEFWQRVGLGLRRARTVVANNR